MSLLDNDNELFKRTDLDFESGFPKFSEKIYTMDGAGGVGFKWENKDIFYNTQYSDGFAIYISMCYPNLRYKQEFQEFQGIRNNPLENCTYGYNSNNGKSNVWQISFYKKEKDNTYLCNRSFIVETKELFVSKNDAIRVIYHFLLNCKKNKIKKGSNMFNFSDEILKIVFGLSFKLLTNTY